MRRISVTEKCYIIILQFSVLTTLNQQQYLELSIIIHLVFFNPLKKYFKQYFIYAFIHNSWCILG